MTEAPGDIAFVGDAGTRFARFTRDAMNTTFGVVLAIDDAAYAQQAAEAAFECLAPMEQELSRFIETSDVTRVSHAAPGEVHVIGADFVECLKTASDVCVATGGAFDVTVGALAACWVDDAGRARTPSAKEIEDARRRTGMSLLQLDEERMAVAVTVEGVRVDLGGVAKGHALDVMARTLAEWDVERALLDSGQSTVLALGAPPGRDAWRLGLRDPGDQRSVLLEVDLRAACVAGSGRHVHGAHIIDPRSASPVTSRAATWSVAGTAATADALSTAFMVMSEDEVASYCAAHGGHVGMTFDAGNVRAHGQRDGFAAVRP